MKRCLPVAVLIMLLYSPSAYASRIASAPAGALARLIGQAISAPAVVRLPTPRDRPLAAAPAPSGQQAGALRLSANVFSPATVQSQYTGTITAATADSDYFRGFHSTGYESFGFVGGYYARADWQPSGASGAVSFRYQGSILGSATQAQNAWNDGITYTNSTAGTTSQNCDNVLTVSGNCAIIAYTTTDNTAVTYLAAQVNMCLIETAAAGPQAVVSANQSQVNQTLSAISSAAITTAESVCSNTPPTTVPTSLPPTATPTPTPRRPTPTPRPPTATPTPRKVRTNFTIVSVRVEKYGAKPDWTLVRPPLKQAKTGARLQISTYYSVHSAPASAKIIVHITIHSSGKTIINQTFHAKLAAHPVDSYRYYVGPWKPTPGVYTISVQVSSGGIAHAGQVAFTVLRNAPLVVPTRTPTARPGKTPVVPRKTPTPRPPSFSFDTLRAFNAKGQPQSTFKVGQRLGWKVTYTVRNLPTKATATIIANYQNPTNGGWRPYGAPGNHQLTASNGANAYSDSFVLPLDYSYGSLRILVGITIGSKTQTRDVTVRITR